MRPMHAVALLLSLSACDAAGPEAASSGKTAGEPEVVELATKTTYDPCPADASWLTSTSPPTEIGGGVPLADETNCQFQQFSWAWFLAMMQPQVPGDAASERAFEAMPNWRGADIKNQCDSGALTGRAGMLKTLFLRDLKPDTKGTLSTTMPTEENQATGFVLYDQASNVVLYNVRYSANECKATAAGFEPNAGSGVADQTNTVEIKSSWRVITGVEGIDAADFFTITADVAGFTGPQTLAMVGFHLVVNTANHPEFVWATFEHKANAPTCADPAATPTGGWSFTSDAAADCLAKSGLAGCSQYDFNASPSAEALTVTGTPDEVCQVYPDGSPTESSTGGNDNDHNRFNIGTLNEQLVGTDGLLTKLDSTDPMAVFANYSLVGSVWTLNGQPSGGADVLRGSLVLANTTMETDAQTNNPSFKADPGCFTCHNYTTSDPTAVSHIYSTLASAAAPAGARKVLPGSGPGALGTKAGKAGKAGKAKAQ